MSFDTQKVGATIASVVVLSTALNGDFERPVAIKAPAISPAAPVKASVQQSESLRNPILPSQSGSADIARMQRVLAHFSGNRYPLINVDQGSSSMSRMDAAIDEINRAVVASEDEGIAMPRTEVVDLAKQIAELVVGLSSIEIACEHNEKGGLELFLKEDCNALLISISDDMHLNIYGDDQKESWIAKYNAQGRAWRRHLPDFIEEMNSI